MNKDDISLLLAHIDITASPKRVEDPEDAKLRRFKDKGLFLATMSAVAILFSVSIWVVIFQNDSPKGTLAMNSLVALTTALIAYYVRGKN